MLMRTFTPALISLAIAGCAAAQAPTAGEDHSIHHPAGAAATQAPQAATADRPAPSPEAFDGQLKAMLEMHQRMQAAKTPAERAALMDEHTQLMQSGMDMMARLRGGGMPRGAAMGAGFGMGMAPPSRQAAPTASPAKPGTGMQGMMGMHDHMERRMAMMEQMMQMMVDRAAAVPGK